MWCNGLHIRLRRLLPIFNSRHQVHKAVYSSLGKSLGVMLSKLSSAVRAVTFSRENQTLRLILVSIKTRQPKLACQILSLAAASSPQKFEALALSKMPVQLLLSFRAGKLSRENETSNNVVADTRKGLIQLLNEDDLLHFQWKERNANEAEDDLIIFPDDAKFVPVAE